MRIVLTADTFPPKCGGSGWSAFEQARALISRGHAITVIRPGTGGETSYQGIKILQCPIHRSGIPVFRHLVGRELFHERFRAFVEQTLSANRPDLIHAQHAVTGPPTIEAAASGGVPSIVTVRDYWPVCLWGTKMRGALRCPGCSYGRIVRCLSANSPATIPISPLAAIYINSYLQRLRRHLLRADAVIAISDRIRSELISFLPEDKVQVIHNFIELSSIAEGYRPPASEPYITFAGKFTVVKGILELLEALRRAHVEIPVVFIGDGPLRQKIADEISSGRIKGRITGWLDRDQMISTIAGGQFNLFASRWDEPLGRVLIEAAAVGRTSVILAAPKSGPWEILEDGRSGLFATDVDQFMKAIRRLVGDPALAARMGEAARTRMTAQFSADAVIPQMEACYETASLKGRS